MKVLGSGRTRGRKRTRRTKGFFGFGLGFGFENQKTIPPGVHFCFSENEVPSFVGRSPLRGVKGVVEERLSGPHFFGSFFCCGDKKGTPPRQVAPARGKHPPNKNTCQLVGEKGYLRRIPSTPTPIAKINTPNSIPKKNPITPIHMAATPPTIPARIASNRNNLRGL